MCSGCYEKLHHNFISVGKCTKILSRTNHKKKFKETLVLLLSKYEKFIKGNLIKGWF